MPNATRLWIELEIGDAGPTGTARDGDGRTRAFSGWLELIATIEAPLAKDDSLPWTREENGTT